MILAFAARTASVLVGVCFGCGAFVTLSTVGIIGVVRNQAGYGLRSHWAGRWIDFGHAR